MGSTSSLAFGFITRFEGKGDGPSLSKFNDKRTGVETRELDSKIHQAFWALDEDIRHKAIG